MNLSDLTQAIATGVAFGGFGAFVLIETACWIGEKVGGWLRAWVYRRRLKMAARKLAAVSMAEALGPYAALYAAFGALRRIRVPKPTGGAMGGSKGGVSNRPTESREHKDDTFDN